jgi:hypothetical protein
MVAIPPLIHGSGQYGAWHAGTPHHGIAFCINTMNGKDVLRQIDSNRYDHHDFPYQVS